MKKDIFEILNSEKFFYPLTGVNKRIYFDCIKELIEYSKTRPILKERDLKNKLESFLSYKQYCLINENKEPEKIIYEADYLKVINKFKECGWLAVSELGESGEYETYITSGCRRIIDLFCKFVDKTTKEQIQNKVIILNNTLSEVLSVDSYRHDKPYSMGLKPALDLENELLNELLDLREEISNIIYSLNCFSNFGDLSKFLLEEKEIKGFFKEYFAMKDNGMVDKYLSNIHTNLLKIKESEILKKIIQEKSERENISLEYSENWIINQIDDLSTFVIFSYSAHMEWIEKKINAYHDLINTKIKSMVEDNHNLYKVIEYLLIHLEESEKTILKNLNGALNIYTQKFISKKSINIRRASLSSIPKKPIKSIKTNKDEDLIFLNEFIKKSSSKYSINHSNSYFNSVLLQNHVDIIDSSKVKNRQDCIEYLFACIYENERNFKFKVNYDNKKSIELPEGKIPEIFVRRKQYGK